MYPLGFGIFHSGIEVNGVEYAYGGHELDSSGIFQMTPKQGIPGLQFRQSIKLGETRQSRPEIFQLISTMSREYTGRSYNIFTRNCNHFSDDLAKKLSGSGIPKWVNRMANFGAMLPCVLSSEAGWAPDAPDLNRGSKK